MEKTRVIAVTGHRPHHLMGGHNHFSFENKMIIYTLKMDLEKELKKAQQVVCISGMAIGVDLLFAIACLELKEVYGARLKLICAIPFEGHGSRWSKNHRIIYSMVRDNADAEVITTLGSVKQKREVVRAMQARNEWMVDNSTTLWAFWDGTPSGTANCVRYAQDKNREVKTYTVGLKINEEGN